MKFDARPKPTLSLQLLNGEETRSLEVGAALRPVDVDAVVENARGIALAAVPPATTFLAGYGKPTQADHDKYAADVDAYAEQVREWARDAVEWMCDRVRVLEADALQRNPASVDAKDAKVSIVFPAGSKEDEDPGDPPEAPERPGFPLRESALTRLNRKYHPDALRVPAMPAIRTALSELEPVKAYSLWEPGYDELPDGCLKVSYARQPVRHREEETSGEPFHVRLPAGDHEVRWTISASNMPHPASGVWKVSCEAEPSGDAIKTLAELEAALRGEPEIEFDWKALFDTSDAA